MTQLLLAAAAAYAIGCLVGAYYVVRRRAGHDIRETGSGNAGARNVLRSGDRTSAVLTLVWDILKGALAVWVARTLTESDAAVAVVCVAVVAGHIWPAQLQFHGGKGVATLIGCLLAIGPRALMGGAWPLAAGAAVACTIVLIVHHPVIDRRRRVPLRPAQEPTP